MSNRKKNKGCPGCFRAFIFFIGIALIISSLNLYISSSSPDEKLTAEVISPSLFTELFLSDENCKILLEVIENATGKRIVVSKEDSGGFPGDVVSPVAVVGHRDNQRFAYISELSPSRWPRVFAYRVQLAPLKVHQTDDTWVQSTISLNMQSQDETIRQQAEKLMSKYYADRP